MEGGCHIGQLELHGLKAAYGLSKLLADSCVLLSCIQAEGCSAQAAGPYVDAAAIHCRDTWAFRTLARNSRRSPTWGAISHRALAFGSTVQLGASSVTKECLNHGLCMKAEIPAQTPFSPRTTFVLNPDTASASHRSLAKPTAVPTSSDVEMPLHESR